MLSENRGFRQSLWCLQHPASLLSIGVLLLNDHVLKSAYPCWFTGKLSDFAGLFFFPFLAAAGLSVLLNRNRVISRYVGHLAFGLVGLWFVLLKTWPTANHMTGKLASTILGRFAGFALDPTDLIALSVLLPGWTLWLRLHRTKPTKLAYAGLCAGAIAAMATSPAAAPSAVSALALQGQSVFAFVDGYGIFTSKDAGATWDRCDSKSCLEMPGLLQAPKMPLVECESGPPQICYRIKGNPSVEISLDGGDTWSTSWEIPAGRVPFLERGREGVPIPKDLIIVESPRRYVLVALGRGGILRRSLPDGDWQRLSIINETVGPFKARDLGEALSSVWSELAIWIGISTGTLIFAGLIVLLTAGTEATELHQIVNWALKSLLRTAGFIILGIVALFVFLLALGAWSWLAPVPEWAESSVVVFSVMTIVVSVPIVLSFWLNARALASKVRGPEQLQARLSLSCFSIALGSSFAGLVIWPLWALGTIWDYDVALGMAGTATALISVLGAVLIRLQTSAVEKV